MWVLGHPNSLTVGVAALAIVVRVWVAASGNFYWDDLILTGRAGTYSLFSPDLLFYDHDGHFMPAAFAVGWIVTALSPLNWVLPLVTLIVLQTLAVFAMIRLLRVLLGDRPILLLPLAFYLFTPLTLPSFAWWAAAMNSLPLQIGLAWVAADAVALCRTGRRRYAWSGVVVFTVSLLFFEKAVLVPLFAFAVLALLHRVDGVQRPVRAALRDGRPLWIPSAVVVVVWAVVYVLVVDQPFVAPTRSMAVGLVEHGISWGLLPTLIGGPWAWQRWLPSPPWADPPVVLIALAWIALAVGVIAVLRRKRRTTPILLAVVAYVLVSAAAMVLARSGPDTTLELAQTLRYFADSAVVIAVGMALIARAPDRALATTTRWPFVSAAPFVSAVVFVVSSLVSTVTFAHSWRDDRTADYLATARASLAEHTDAPMLDLPVPADILLPVVYPNNLASRVFSPLPKRPQFTASSPVLRSMDNQGHVVDADVSPTRAITQGPEPRCGYRVEGSTVARLPLDGPLAPWEWTAQLNYAADRDGQVSVGLDESPMVTVPVERGLHTVFVRLIGSGSSVRLYPQTRDLSLCVGAGPVGGVLPRLG